jgi:phage/plasmid-associated DNA primase
MKIVTSDHGTWRRMRVVPFLSLFTENPVDTDPRKPFQFKIDSDIKETKLEGWKHVFFGMLVRIAFVTNGVVPVCSAVTAASDNYRKQQDVFAEYIDTCIIVDPERIVKKPKLRKHFQDWWRQNYPPTKQIPDFKDLEEYMNRRFNANSTSSWRDIRLLEHSNSMEEED